jgi:hypothetical protein
VISVVSMALKTVTVARERGAFVDESIILPFKEPCAMPFVKKINNRSERVKIYFIHNSYSESMIRHNS